MTVFAGATLVGDLTIIVTPTAKRPGLYEARLEDGCILVRATRQPFLDAARHLINLGRNPATMLTMRWAGSDTACLIASIGVAAKLTIDEHNGTAFAHWKPFLRSAVASRIAPAARASTKAMGTRQRTNGKAINGA
ncbi:MAG: hypothetical protein WCI56_14940 [Hyphomicrobiales bacterium]